MSTKAQVLSWMAGFGIGVAVAHWGLDPWVELHPSSGLAAVGLLCLLLGFVLVVAWKEKNMPTPVAIVAEECLEAETAEGTRS